MQQHDKGLVNKFQIINLCPKMPLDGDKCPREPSIHQNKATFNELQSWRGIKKGDNYLIKKKI